VILHVICIWYQSDYGHLYLCMQMLHKVVGRARPVEAYCRIAQFVQVNVENLMWLLIVPQWFEVITRNTSGRHKFTPKLHPLKRTVQVKKYLPAVETVSTLLSIEIRWMHRMCESIYTSILYISNLDVM
jgi:hypothetical protein